MKKISLYIHIPFCVKKCDYCDFLSAPATRDEQVRYVAALENEIISKAVYYNEYVVESVFFGGGTPSILEALDIGGVLDVIFDKFKISDDVEITLETNPGTVNLNKLKGLKNAGINRLSIGLQSANNSELSTIGRIHTYEDFLNTYMWARDAGFDNINIDLMSALPGQNMDSWVETLEKVFSLNPEHISAYSLIVEERTRLYDNLDKYPPVPGEDEDRRMYCETKRLMSGHGYERYEISNYAKPGYECRHNIVYWRRGNYVGLGLGASSMVENVRWKNTDSMEMYLKYSKDGSKIHHDLQRLSEGECMEEFMFLGLRLMSGVSIKEFNDCFGKSLTDVYGDVLKRWTSNGMIVHQNDRYMLSDKGIDVSNVILSDFILD